MTSPSERALARMKQLDGVELKTPQEIQSLSGTLPEDVAKLVDWIPKRRYMALYDETEAMIFKRIAW